MLFELIHPDERPEVERQFKTVAGEDSEIRKGIFRVQHKDGHWVPFETLGRWIFDRQGTALRIVMSARDISERKEVQKNLVENS